MAAESESNFRLVAIIGPIVDRDQTIHYWSSKEGPQQSMAFPEVVLIDGDSQSCMLYRYRIDGEFCGDSWHQCLEDAKQSCNYEYGNALGSWASVPVSVDDAIDYAIKFASNQQ